MLSIADAAENFLTAKDGQVKQQTLGARTFRDYIRTLNRVVQFFGATRSIESLTPADFWRYQDEC